MLEIFKTNVNSSYKANLLVEKIRNKFTGYMVTFDLEDEDRILRVKSNFSNIQTSAVINLLNEEGFEAEIIPDDYPQPFLRSLIMQKEV